MAGSGNYSKPPTRLFLITDYAFPMDEMSPFRSSRRGRQLRLQSGVAESRQRAPVGVHHQRPVLRGAIRLDRSRATGPVLLHQLPAIQSKAGQRNQIGALILPRLIDISLADQSDHGTMHALRSFLWVLSTILCVFMTPSCFRRVTPIASLAV